MKGYKDRETAPNGRKRCGRIMLVIKNGILVVLGIVLILIASFNDLPWI